MIQQQESSRRSNPDFSHHPGNKQRTINLISPMVQTEEELSTNNDLFEAAKNGDVEALRTALKNGANAKFECRKEEGAPTSLHESIKLRNENGVQCTKLLLENGADIDATLLTNCNTPLIDAAGLGAENICELLIEKSKEQLDSKDGEPHILKSNSYGNTPLHAAVRSGSVDTVRLLIDNGADLSAINHVGSSALHLCAFLCQVTEKNKSPDGSSISKDRRASRLTAVEPHLQIAAMLLACNEKHFVDAVDSNSHTALHIAAQRGCIDLVKLLVDSGASLTLKTSIDHKGRGGRTAIDCAEFGGMKETQELLLQMKDMKNENESIIVTNKMAKDLEGGYSVSNPIVGSGGAAVRRRSYTKKSESEKSFSASSSL